MPRENQLVRVEAVASRTGMSSEVCLAYDVFSIAITICLALLQHLGAEFRRKHSDETTSAFGLLQCPLNPGNREQTSSAGTINPGGHISTREVACKSSVLASLSSEADGSLR